MTRTEKAWLAGAVDCDGYITATVVTHRRIYGDRLFTYDRALNIKVGIANRHPRIIQHAKAHLEEIVGKPVTIYKAPTGMMIVEVAGPMAVPKVLRVILPHLVGKRDQAVLALGHLEGRTKRRGRTEEQKEADVRFVASLQRLNQRYLSGTVETETGGPSVLEGDETVRSPRIPEGGEDAQTIASAT